MDALRALSPLEALRAWLQGGFDLDEEVALLEAIQKDPDVTASEDFIICAIYDARQRGLTAESCLAHLTQPDVQTD